MPPGLSLSRFRAVLFDVDGTLVDSLRMIIQGLGDTYEHFSGCRPTDSEIKALIGMPLRVQLGLFRDTALAESEVDQMSRYTLERFSVYQHDEVSFDSAVETLKLCHGMGLKTALVTSKNSIELEGFLKRFTGSPFVDTTVCASDVIHPKPAPDSAILACRILDVEPQEAVFIGDSVYDLQCAQAAGMPCVAVSYGAAPADVLAKQQPDLMVHSPDELLEWARSAFMETTCREKGF